MKRLNYAIKQAHLTALKFTRGDAASVNLTPARVDMLRMLLSGGRQGMSQAELRRNLGVASPTVSIMVRALEALGFVQRTPHSDRRTWLVTLTDLAKTALRFIQWMTHVQSHYRLADACVFSRDAGVPQKGWKKTVNRLRKRLDTFVDRLGRDGVSNPWDYFEDENEFYDAEVPENPITFDLIPVDWDDNFAGEDDDDDNDDRLPEAPMHDLLADMTAAGLGHPDADTI